MKHLQLTLSSLLLFLSMQLAAQVSIPSYGSAVMQDFNTLAMTGTSSATPAGWTFAETGTNANTTYTAGTGSSNIGDTYSFGSSGSAERAFGGLQSGSLIPTIGGSFTNNTGGPIVNLSISYKGEQWRLGALGRVDRLDFQYSLNATSLTTGTWTDVNSLDFTAPVTTGTVGALDGNASGNFTLISFTITGLNIANGSTFWIRWSDFNASGSDDGLAADDFSLTACPANASCPSNTSTCVSSPAFTLTGGTPAGGTYSGTGVSGGMFDPAVAGVGTHTITYMFSAGSCSSSCMFTITVLAAPTAEAGTYPPVCATAPNVTLTGTPPGGTWTGIGIVNGNQFDPNAGTQTLTYTANFGSGCSASDQTTITVNACLTPPEMRFILLNDNGQQNGTCVSQSDCDLNKICFGIQYTPNVSGNLTSYTTGFVMSCINGQDPVLTNASCVMTNNSFVQNACASFNQVQWNFLGNTGSVPVVAGTPKIVHQVCFTIPNSGALSLDPFPPPPDSCLSTSVDLTGGGFGSEVPAYVRFSFDSILYCGILPVKYLQFEVTKFGDFRSKLEWMTTEEINNSHFMIERSNDGGKTFRAIGRVEAATEPRSINIYQFIDEAARPGVNYYRLKQYDLDGRSEYSPMRFVMFTTPEFSVKAWPSPVRDLLNVYISHAEEAGQFTLVDLAGRTVAEVSFADGDSSHEIAVDRMIPGVYSLIVKAGQEVRIEKIVVVR